jgi:hypothetical protein
MLAGGNPEVPWTKPFNLSAPGHYAPPLPQPLPVGAMAMLAVGGFAGHRISNLPPDAVHAAPETSRGEQGLAMELGGCHQGDPPASRAEFGQRIAFARVRSDLVGARAAEAAAEPRAGVAPALPREHGRLFEQEFAAQRGAGRRGRNGALVIFPVQASIGVVPLTYAPSPQFRPEQVAFCHRPRLLPDQVSVNR